MVKARVEAPKGDKEGRFLSAFKTKMNLSFLKDKVRVYYSTMDRGVPKRNQRKIQERAAKEKRDEQRKVSTRDVRRC